ncbi:MAG TPA: hypothetical protein VFQ85_15265 [Mycobacteriales bacterium]|jgi:hypothetical protein|nr:hypothetical protein [Mycobacteriales bacterium]
MRTLTLRKELLAELTGEELGQVGGAGLNTQVCLTDPCITTPVTGLRCLLSLDVACS